MLHMHVSLQRSHVYQWRTQGFPLKNLFVGRGGGVNENYPAQGVAARSKDRREKRVLRSLYRECGPVAISLRRNFQANDFDVTCVRGEIACPADDMKLIPDLFSESILNFLTRKFIEKQ